MSLIELMVWLSVTAAAVDGGAGALDNETVRRVIREHHAHTWACYEKNLSADSVTDFRVALTLVISASGQVESAVANSSTSGPEIEACLVAEAKTWRFPKRSGGPLSIRYPFIFKADED